MQIESFYVNLGVMTNIWCPLGEWRKIPRLETLILIRQLFGFKSTTYL